MKFSDFLFQTGTALTVKILGSASAFLLTVYVTRSMPQKEAGLFFLGLAVINILSAVSRTGLDNTVIRFVSAKRESSITIMAKSLGLTSLTSLIVILPILAFSDAISIYLFNKPELAPTLFSIAPAILFFSYLMLLGGAAQGMGNTSSSIIIRNILPSLGFCILFYLNTKLSVFDAGFLYTLSCAITCLIGLIFFVKHSSGLNNEISWSELERSFKPLWAVAIMGQMAQMSGQFVSGIYCDPEDISVLAAAQRTAMLTSFILIAVNLVVAPRFAKLFQEEKHHELERLAINSVRMLLIITIPTITLVLIFADLIMLIFGPTFEDGGDLLRILALGQFMNAAAGSVGLLLSMTGHEKDLRNNTIVSGILALALCITTIPFIGVYGAAVSTAVATGIQNILGVIMVKKRLGFSTLKIY